MINKAIIVGNLGKEPELRYTQSGTAVCNFSVATTERYKDREGNKQEKTEWHNIVVWQNLAEICSKYLHKGKQVYIEGKLQTSSYDDKEGVKKYKTEIVAHTMQMLGSVSDSQNGNKRTQEPQQSGGQQPPPPEQPPYDPDDEIPF